MPSTSKNNNISSTYLVITAVAVLASWVMHEFAHWAAGRFLGYDMAMELNRVFPIKGSYDKHWHYPLVSAAGPVFTLAQAIIIYFIMQTKKNLLLYPFLFTCFYMRLFAGIISIRNLNDEARISKTLGLGTYTLPVIMIAILFFLVYKISRKYNFSWKFNLINLGLIILFSSIIILANQFYPIRLL